MLKKIMIVLIGVIVSSCGTTKVKIHVPLELTSPCEFTKFTEVEKNSMTEAVGMRIDKNQNNCYANEKANQKILIEHNEKHKLD